MFVGIDVGSLSAETVILDRERTIRGFAIVPTGVHPIAAAERALDISMKMAEITRDQIRFTIATGYGRVSIPFADQTVTEITCHALGAHSFFPATRTIIDIGGQDSKVIKLDKDGKVVDFLMNDKCAAGTGRFLEVMAKALETGLSDLGQLSLQAKKEITISSMCTVFAESEVVSLIGHGEVKEDIARGVHCAIGQRVVNMVKRVGIQNEITMTGGVAKNKGIVSVLKEKLNTNINLPEEPQIIGAFGAALAASRKKL